MIGRLKDAGSLLSAAISGYGRHNLGRMGGAIAFDGILSIAPLGVMLVTIAGLVFGRNAVEGVIIDQLRDTLGQDAAGTLQRLLRGAYVSRATVPATVLAFAVLIFGATRLIGDVRGSLNSIWEVKGHGKGGLKGWLVGKSVDVVAVFILAGLLLATMLAQTAANAITHYFVDLLPLGSGALHASSILFSLVVASVVFMVIFHWLPNVDLGWRDVVFGGVVTAILFTIGNYAVGFYLGRTSPGSAFGAAGSFIVIMLWMNYSALMVLFGAEITHAWGQRARPAGQPVSTTEASRAKPGGVAPAAEAAGQNVAPTSADAPMETSGDVPLSTPAHSGRGATAALIAFGITAGLLAGCITRHSWMAQGRRHESGD